MTGPLACRDLEVPLPDDLSRFGGKVMIRISGKVGGPPVAVLGGISGNRFVCTGTDGGGGWWPGLVGQDCAVDPRQYRIIGLDFAADPTGRAAPSTRDQAYVLGSAIEAAGIQSLHAIVGASYGGMVALSFAESFPARAERLVIISAPAEPHPAASAARELQRRIVGLGMLKGAADEALSIARGLAMLTYRTPEEFAQRFCGGLPGDDPLSASEPGLYLRARGEAFSAAMSCGRFLSLSASIDRHEIDPARIAAPNLLIGALSDQLVPPGQIQALAAALQGRTEMHLLESLYGHDMFLKESEAVGRLVQPFLEGAS
ncbi:MAG: alpha/beta fold hydrolase [Sphingosinicella sp.]|nr:alpha/beta fold hydrolase [Sphingosinicella sp.]